MTLLSRTSSLFPARHVHHHDYSSDEAAILSYLARKKTACVGIISLMTRIDEPAVRALLLEMAKRDLVERTRGEER